MEKKRESVRRPPLSSEKKGGGPERSERERERESFASGDRISPNAWLSPFFSFVCSASLCLSLCFSVSRVHSSGVAVKGAPSLSVCITFSSASVFLRPLRRFDFESAWVSRHVFESRPGLYGCAWQYLFFRNIEFAQFLTTRRRARVTEFQM